MFEDLKREVLQAALESYREGLFAGTSGNLSIYDRKNGVMIITPTNLPYEGMKKKDLVAINLQGEVIDGIHAPSSEWRLHSAVYAAREDCNAVVHTHSPYATSFAVTHEEIPLILIEMVPFLGGSVRVAKFAINGTPEVGTYAVEALEKRFACLLANHGAMAIGADLAKAKLSAVYLEDAAKIYAFARNHGEVKILSKDVELAMRKKYNLD